VSIVNLNTVRSRRPSAADEAAADTAARAAARAALATFLSAVEPAERHAPGAEAVGLREMLREAAALLVARHGADPEEAAEAAEHGAALALAEAQGAAG
jgi:hypothetical protein